MKKIQFDKRPVCTILWTTFISFFSYKMLVIIWPYTTWKWTVDFLLTKTLIIHLDHYRLAFYSHIFSSLIVLICGAFLFSGFILKKWPVIHRWIGKTYVGLLLFISAPSGLVMAYYANGGWMAKSSFLLLTPLWWWFTWKGYQTARNKNFKQHKRWMMRSYALTLSAISLRVYQLILGQVIYLDPTFQYIFVSWLSWLGNWVFIEIWLKLKYPQSANNRYSFHGFLASAPKNFPFL